MELKMELKIILVFVGVVGVAYILYRVVMKKIGRWDPE
jgi:predicted permease